MSPQFVRHCQCAHGAPVLTIVAMQCAGLHMLTPRGQGTEMKTDGDTPASVVRTLQKHTSEEMAKFSRTMQKHTTEEMNKSSHQAESLSAKQETMSEDLTAVKNQLRGIEAQLRELAAAVAK